MDNLTYISDTYALADFRADGFPTMVNMRKIKEGMECTVYFKPDTTKITFIDYTRGVGTIENPTSKNYLPDDAQWKDKENYFFAII